MRVGCGIGEKEGRGLVFGIMGLERGGLITSTTMGVRTPDLFFPPLMGGYVSLSIISWRSLGSGSRLACGSMSIITTNVFLDGTRSLCNQSKGVSPTPKSHFLFSINL